jgi:hypothetical protein
LLVESFAAGVTEFVPAQFAVKAMNKIATTNNLAGLLIKIQLFRHG